MSTSGYSDAEIAHILQHIDEAFEAAAIDEVGVIVAAPDSPAVVRANEKLGIAHTVIKPMFKYVIGQLCGLDASVGNDSIAIAAQCKLINSLTRMLLLIKGDFPLAYKLRKQLIELNLIEISSEIETIVLIFGRTPKTTSGWHHRRWCLTTNMQRKNRTSLSAAEIESERELCRRFAESSPKNYYCWMHRLWLLEHMSDSQLLDELSFTHDWLVSHVSDHSACSHRNQVIFLLVRRLTVEGSSLYSLLEGCIPRYHATHEQVFSFLFQCIETSSALIHRRPGHEALWYHRRSMLVFTVHLVKVLSNWPTVAPTVDSIASSSSATIDIKADALNPLYSGDTSCQNDLLLALLTNVSSTQSLTCWLYRLLLSEVAFSRSCIESKDVWDYEAQKAMALRYTVFAVDIVRSSLEASHKVVDLKILEVAASVQKFKFDQSGSSAESCDLVVNSEELYKICCRCFGTLSPLVQSFHAVYRS